MQIINELHGGFNFLSSIGNLTGINGKISSIHLYNANLQHKYISGSELQYTLGNIVYNTDNTVCVMDISWIF